MEQCLRRELTEELGITCGIVVPWLVQSHAYPDVTVLLHFMHVLTFSGEPAPYDGQELRWVTPEEACSLRFLPADESVVSSIRRPSEGQAG